MAADFNLQRGGAPDTIRYTEKRHDALEWVRHNGGRYDGAEWYPVNPRPEWVDRRVLNELVEWGILGEGLPPSYRVTHSNPRPSRLYLWTDQAEELWHAMVEAKTITEERDRQEFRDKYDPAQQSLF